MLKLTLQSVDQWRNAEGAWEDNAAFNLSGYTWYVMRDYVTGRQLAGMLRKAGIIGKPVDCKQGGLHFRGVYFQTQRRYYDDYIDVCISGGQCVYRFCVEQIKGERA